jgi:two-component system, OmpR family, sensor histidine kinase VanS
VVLTVENTGEQLTPQLLSTLIEPFHRGSKRIRTDRAGVAPAIVNSITGAHHGSLTLSLRGGPGGALSLPPAEEAPPLAALSR